MSGKMRPAIQQIVEKGKKNDGAFKGNIKERAEGGRNEYWFNFYVYPALFNQRKQESNVPSVSLDLPLVSTPALSSSHVAPNLENVSGEEVDGNTQ